MKDASLKQRILTDKQAFFGHSFSDYDTTLVSGLKDFLAKLGLACDSGERPEGKSISEKIKERIRAADVFVGLFTRREKIAESDTWTTSSWVIEEKAMAIQEKKRLLLFVEDGVADIGGLQGDYEYISFRRDALHNLYSKSVDYVFSVTTADVDPSKDADLEKLGGAYGRALRAQKAGNIPLAISCMRQCLKQAPRNPRYLNKLGYLLVINGDTEEAISQHKKAIEIDATGGGIHQLAHAYERAGQVDTALYTYQRALDVDPGEPENYFCYAEALYRKYLAMTEGVEKEQTLVKVRRLFDQFMKIAPEEDRKKASGYMLAIK